MITLALLIWFGFGEGAQIAAWMFVVAAMFDLSMAEVMFDSDDD
jgi:hypothetical protein